MRTSKWREHVAPSYTELCYKLFRGRTKSSTQNVSINWHFPALHSVVISHCYQGAPWAGELHSGCLPALSCGSQCFSLYQCTFFLLCNTPVNRCVLVSPIFAMSQNIYSGLSEANYYRCLSVCNGGCYWSDLLKNIAMLRNKHKKTQRMLFTDTTERKKRLE